MKEKNKFQALGKNLKRFWNEPPSGRFLNLKEILRLGVSSLGVSFIANFISIYHTISNIPILYDMGDAGTLHATAMYLAASVLALAFTPLYGKMMQHTKSRFGRYKPYILFLAPVVAILGVFAVWSPNSLDQTQRIIYVYMTCTPTIFLWNLWFNTFNMFPGVFTPNQQERADIWSPIGLVIGFAPTVMNAVKGLVIAWKGDIWAGRIYGLLSAVLGLICIIALLGVKERVFVTEEEEKKEKVSAIEGLKMIVKNKPLMILTLAICLGSLKNTIDLCWDVMARVKYATDVNTSVALIGGLSLFVGFAATPNMILLPWMTRKFNNRTILLFWQGCNVTANLVLALIGFQNFPQGSWSPYVITFLRFVSLFNALGSLQPLILSEIGDLQQAKSGYRLEGFIQTFAYSLTAVVAQFAALIPAAIQYAMKFNPANYQVPEGVTGEVILSPENIQIAENYGNVALWISVVSSALMLICLIFYDLDKKKHAEIVEQLKSTAVNIEEMAKEEGSLNFLEDVTDTKEDKSIKDLVNESNENSQSEQYNKG
ncbi:MAG: MFS transporter, partial [Clostridia bacterium]|nr:MFS transporter [Clostridia bacterium]